jgi:predicted kinase
VLELEDLEDRPLDVDVVAVLELVRRDNGKSVLLQAKPVVTARQLSARVYFSQTSDHAQSPTSRHSARATARFTPKLDSVAAQPILYLMVGLPAAGKTTAARRLAEETSSLRLSPDEWMLPLFGPSNPDEKRDVVEGKLIETALDVLRIGTSVILDFGFWSRDERSSVRWLARQVGADCRVIYVSVDQATQLTRVDGRLQLAPEHTFEVSPDELAAWREHFEVPDQTELDGSNVEAPPAGYGSWSEFASARWPALPQVSERLRDAAHD